MGALLGLMLGLGLLLILRAGRQPEPGTAARRPGWAHRTRDVLAQAGIEAVTPGQLVTVSVVFAVLTLIAVVAISRSPAIAVAFGCFAAAAPLTLVRHRARRRCVELSVVWPEAIDNITSAIRAGMSLPEALAALGVRGPEQLRSPFARFGQDYRATGRFGDCLDRLEAALADPVADRVVESLRMAREVGGTDLGRLLRTLSAFLREDARTRAELVTRQGWTISAARLALAAPWLLLGVLSLRPNAVRAYNTGTGVVVLLLGGAVSLVAYRVMLRIARLPTERRVLR